MTSGRSRSARPSSSTGPARSAGRRPAVSASRRRARWMPSRALPRRAELPLLFVYGTLMRGEPAHRLLLGRTTFVEEGHTDGLLLDLGQFPGVIEGNGRVAGEVFRLDRPELLETLDDYEGYNF